MFDSLKGRKSNREERSKKSKGGRIRERKGHVSNSEVLTLANAKIIVFWNVVPYSLVESY
jgi:hypothetical protein